MPAAVLAVWVAATLFWWAFAFMPLPSAPPEWLAAARYACFGAIDSGLPEAQGWMMLVLGPASFLFGIVVLWGSELVASLRGATRSRWGRLVAVVLLVATGTEATWVAAKVRAAAAVERWDTAAALPAALPPDYPRQSTPAPDFTLVDQRGDTIRLAALRGRPVVLTFVFAHCESLCPLVVEAIKAAGPADAGAEVMLVTLDPWRDTPSALPGLARQWALPPGFHLLTARSVEQVLDVARSWGVPFARDERSGDISHPGLVFVVDADGRIAYTFNSPPAGWVRDGLDRLG